MMDKIKQVLTAVASVSALLYGTGFIAEFAHARMLGISMVEPDNVYYLISGGTVYLKSLIALYLSLSGPRALYFIPLILMIAGLVFYENKWGEKKRNRLPKTYVITMTVLAAVLLRFAIPVFSSSMYINKLLPPAPKTSTKQAETLDYPRRVAAELSSWIRNQDENAANLNRQKLYDVYTTSLLTLLVSGTLLFSAFRRRRCWNPIPPPIPAENQSRRDKMINYARPFKRPLFFVLIMLLALAAAVQLLLFPLNYGVLIHSNHYPNIAITMEPDTESLIYGKNDKYWLIRQNKELLLIYALVAVKGEPLPEYKLFTLKKKDVKKIDIIDINSIFMYK